MSQTSGNRLATLAVATALLAATSLAGCGSSGKHSAEPTNTPAVGTDTAATAAKLSDEDLVGQVLMPYAYGSSATDVSAGSAAGNRKIGGVATPAELIAKYRLGGLILVGFSADDPTASTNPTTNVDSPAQVRALTTGLQAAAGKLPAHQPLLIGTDQEFGVVTRIGTGVTVLPSEMALGAAGKPELTEAAWRTAATELAAMGITVNFAPVADVLGENDGGVIGSRSFGDNPTAASDQITAAVRGIQGAGVAATLKHFPGHGHTTSDSHQALPVLKQSLSALRRDDWPPFQAGIAAGAWLVMSGHLDAEAIDPGTPASFSHEVLTDVLRGQLGFTGVVVTDAMNMEPARKWPPAEAAVRALNAGNDILLMPPDLPAVYDGLLAALRDGSLPRARLVDAVTHILTVKNRLATFGVPDMSVVDSAAHRAAVLPAAQGAVTLLRGQCRGALVSGPVTVTAAKGRDRARTWLAEALRADGMSVVDSGGSIVHLVGYGDAAADLNPKAEVTVAMDTPYLLAKSSSRVLLATYSSTQLSMTGLAAVLAGKVAPAGHAPVPVAGLPRSACD